MCSHAIAYERTDQADLYNVESTSPDLTCMSQDKLFCVTM